MKNRRLQIVFYDDKVELEQSITAIKTTLDPLTFKYEVLIAFWLSIHLERLELCQYLCTQASILNKIIKNVRRLALSLKKNDDAAGPSDFGRVSGTDKWTVSETIPRGLNSKEDLSEFKEMLKTSAGQTFNSNVVRIALNMQEEKIASLLIA